ncbi:MAG: hypothetical protein ISR99_02715 [Parcubacteria group bacterium]|nr:hypothetical protein [Parcubacteria group bacterium]
MKTLRKNKLVSAFLISAVLSVIAVVALTIGGELHKPLKNWLADMFTHHWVGKGVLTFVGFYILGLILQYTGVRGIKSVIKLIYLLSIVALIGALAIIGFYYYEVFIAIH